MLLPALRAAGIDARFLGLDVPGSDAPRFYERLDAADVPYRSVRCGLDVSPRMARDVIRAVRAERPDLLHTHLVHADVYGAIAARTTRTPYVSTRHNDDRYLLGPVPLRRPRLRPRRPQPDRDLGCRPGVPRASRARPAQARDDPLRARRAGPGAVRADARGGRSPDRRAARARRGQADRAEGSRDAAAGVRAREEGRARGAARDPRQRPARRRHARARRRARSRRRRHDARPDGDPGLARARRRLRPHVALGGIRDRAARGDAGLAAGRRDARQRRAGGGRRRRDRRARGSGRRRGRRAGARGRSSPIPSAPAGSARPDAPARWRSSRSLGWSSARSRSTAPSGT